MQTLTTTLPNNAL